jgi:acyl carrier protein
MTNSNIQNVVDAMNTEYQNFYLVESNDTTNEFTVQIGDSDIHISTTASEMRDIICSQFCVDDTNFDGLASRVNGDALDWVEFVMILEEKFDVEIPDEIFEYPIADPFVSGMTSASSYITTGIGGFHVHS